MKKVLPALLIVLFVVQTLNAQNPSVAFVVTSSSESEGIGSFQIAVSIQNPNSNPTTVDINVIGGSATSGVDYSYSPIMVTFPANSTVVEFVTINLTDDIIAEGNESFTFLLRYPGNNATLGADSQHVVTIVDNDTLRFDISPNSLMVQEDTGTITIPVTLSHISANTTTVTVHLEAVGTTATQGNDFYFNDTTLTWPPNSFGPILVPVSITDDNLFEANETVMLRLINPTNGAALLNDTFLLIIENNDTLTPVDCTNLFFSEYIEGLSDNKALEIFNPTSSSVDLSNYKIFKFTDGGNSAAVLGLNGVLLPDSSYIGANPSSDILITAQADTLSAFFDFTGNDALALIYLTDTIDVIGQIGVDPGLSWTLTGGSTENHTLIRNYYNYKGDTSWSIAAGTWDVYANGIFDSLGFHHTAPCGTPVPVPPASVHFTVLSDTVIEDSAAISVVIQIDNPSSVPVSVFIARDDNAATASAGADYNFINQNFTTNAGGTTFDTIRIATLEDRLIEPIEKVVLHFLNVSANTNVVQDSTFTLYIVDNDTLTSSFLGAGFSYVEGDTLVGVKVFLSTFPDTSVSVKVSVAPGSATVGSDFVFSDTILIFPTNSTDTQVAWITIIDDNIVEPNEQINFDLTDIFGLLTEISAYTLTIIDNDSIVGITQIDSDHDIQIFPNPVVNFLSIQSNHPLGISEVTDLIGNVVISPGKLALGRNVIDVSLLPAGMYFLSVRDGNKVFTRRFIKQD